MKIRTKLFSGFSIIVVIGIFLGAVGFYSTRKLTLSSEYILGLSETRSRTSAILNSHYIWRHGLSETVYSGKEFSGSLDSTTCSLGKWLNSDEVKKVTDPESISLLDQIVEPHRFIHNKAGEIIEHLKNNEMNEALKKFREDVLPKTLEVISYLEKIETRCGELLDEDINGIYTFGMSSERIIIVFCIIALIASAILTLVITSIIVKPIVTVTDTLKDISEGEGDLTHVIPEKGNDEITNMSRYFNLTLAKIKNMVISIKEHAAVLSDTGNDLASNMTETAAAMNQITANIQSIKNRVINQSASVSQTGAAMEQITYNIDRLNEYVEEQTASVSQSSSSIEEMIANILSVTRTLFKNGESVNELSSASELGRVSLQDAAAIIHEIADNSEGLLEINKVMKNIANETNLLSMNAAIEAAHAGEAGEGFAVVAEEIRKLSESSAKQSKTISAVLKNMKASIDKLTESTGKTLTRFEVIDSDVKTVSEQEGVIRNAMEEQNEGSNLILEAVGKLNEITKQVKSESAQMIDGSHEVIQESRNLDQVTQEITGGINEMASGAEQINFAVNKVNEISVKNRENIDILVHEVSMFKVA